MPDDMRWRLGTSGHLKILRLISTCGERSFRALVALWEYAAQHRQDGRLHGMDEADIAVAAGWPEAPPGFVPQLVLIGLLDGPPMKYRIHDWRDNQQWIIGAKKRSRKALRAAEIRWEKRNAPSIETDARSNAPSNATRNAPSDHPTTREESGSGRVRASADGAAPAGGQTGPKPIPKPPCGGASCREPTCCEDGLRNSRPKRTA